MKKERQTTSFSVSYEIIQGTDANLPFLKSLSSMFSLTANILIGFTNHFLFFSYVLKFMSQFYLLGLSWYWCMPKVQQSGPYRMQTKCICNFPKLLKKTAIFE